MATQRHGQIIETPTEARQAEPGPSVLALLTVSTGLAILILGVVWFVFFPDLSRAGPLLPCRLPWAAFGLAAQHVQACGQSAAARSETKTYCRWPFSCRPFTPVSLIS